MRHTYLRNITASKLDMFTFCRHAVKSLPFSVLVVLLLSATAFSQSGRVQPTPTPTPDDDTVRVVTEEIKLNVLAFDESGSFFSGVTDNDLVITEDDILHQPSSVRRLPANVLIVMDTGGDLRAVKSLDRTRRAAEALIAALRPGDSMAIMDYSDKAEIVGEWTTVKAQSLAAIKKTNFGRRSAYVAALKMATDFLLRLPLENRHLILITDGTDSAGASSAKYDAYQRLLTTDISVHVLSYTAMESTDIEPRTKGISNTPPPKAMPDEIAAQLPNGVRDAAQAVKIGPTISLDKTLINKMKNRKLDLDTSQEQLEKIAENTNGEFILPLSPQEMVDKAPLVARMIDASYVVTYTPKVPVQDTRGIAERNIMVTSKRPGLIVQARRKLLVKTAK